MLSVRSTNQPKPAILFFLLIFVSHFGLAQQNSPFSRFGLGDVLPHANILNRAMGSLSVAHADASSINFANPAGYSRLGLVTFDIGLTVDNRTLKSADPVNKYNSVNFTPSYVFLGLPLSTDRQRLKKRTLSLVLGLRPVTTSNYSVREGRKILPNNIDSVVYLYEGSGGLNEAVVGLGKRWGGLSIGINAGYTFGRKENETRTFIGDTSLIPANRSLSSTSASFGGGFINGGLLYEGSFNEKTAVRIGFAGRLSQKISGQQDVTRRTFFYNGAGTTISLDTVFSKVEEEGTIRLPASYSAGITLVKKFSPRAGFVIEDKSIGIEYSSTQWADYRYFDRNEGLVNSWMLKIGGHIIPKPFDANFWNNVAYRAGFNIGRDYISAHGNDYRTYSFSIGAGLPLLSRRTSQSTQINTALEIGKRGTKVNNITENFVRFSVGLSLSDIWFIKRKYD